MVKTLLKSVREYKKATILTPFFVALEVVMEVLLPFVMALLIDQGIEKGNMNVIYKYGFILILFALLSLLFGYLSGRFASIASSGFAKNLRHDMYYKVKDYSFANIDKFSTSSIITRLTTDVTNVTNAFQMAIRIAVRAPLMFVFSLIMAFSLNAKISLIYLIVAPILLICLLIIANKAKPRFESVFKTYDELNNTVQENIRGIRVVKAFVQEDYEKNKFNKISNKIYNNFVKAQKTVILASPLMQLCMYTCIIFISWISAKLIVGGMMTTGELTSFITYTATILSSLMMLSMIYVMFMIAIPSAERCLEIINEKIDLESPVVPIKQIKDGSISFQNVSFSYVKSEDKLVLKNINLDIKSGEVIGIIGATGSGKSTLVNLIPRLYDVTKGKILIGGVDVRDYDLKLLRDEVACVLQKNVLFKGTIKENLLWGNEKASMEDIIRVCKLSEASEFINSFEDKYDTLISQGGTNVSGGQKQRLCIARALLKKPKIIILDDSTSACDTKTDSLIRKNFKEYLPKVTKIIIAQRISSIEDADRVIVIDDGKIDAFDTPSNLLKTNKIYREVYNLQTRGDSNATN